MSRRRPEPEEAEPFTEHLMFPHDFTQEELAEAVLRLLDHLGLDAVRTNRTKHGDVQIELQPKERPPFCAGCGTTEGLHRDYGSGGPYRCASTDCMVF